VATYHVSEMNSWSRCPAAYGYEKRGVPRQQTSALAYGTVIHHVVHGLEREIWNIRIKQDRQLRNAEAYRLYQESVAKAVRTFTYYWHPHNIEGLTDPVVRWLPRQGYSELRSRGIDAIRKYADLIRFDDHELLGLEFGFQVPIDGTWDDELGQPHWLAGTVDRLALRYYRRVPGVAIDDYKTGKEQRHLRWNLQFTGYCYASTKREFWVGARGEDGFGEARGEELYQRTLEYPRRGTWINMRTFKFQDAGWRAALDYERLGLAVEQMHASVVADIYPLSISGDACAYCDFASVCGGMGRPDENYGQPA